MHTYILVCTYPPVFVGRLGHKQLRQPRPRAPISGIPTTRASPSDIAQRPCAPPSGIARAPRGI